MSRRFFVSTAALLCAVSIQHRAHAQVPCFDIQSVVQPPTGFSWSGAAAISDMGPIGITATISGVDPKPFHYQPENSSCLLPIGTSAAGEVDAPLGRVTAFAGCMSVGFTGDWFNGSAGWLQVDGITHFLPITNGGSSSVSNRSTSSLTVTATGPTVQQHDMPTTKQIIISSHPQALSETSSALLIAASAELSDLIQRPVLYTVPWNGTTITDDISFRVLNDKPGIATDVDVLGHWAVGMLEPATSPTRAVAFDLVNEETTVLDTLGGALAEVFHLNAAGTEALGYAQTATGALHAVRWLRFQEQWFIHDLGILPGSAGFCIAYDANDDFIIGQCVTDDTKNFVIDRNNLVMQEITLCDSTFEDTNYVEMQISGLNSFGEIAATLCYEDQSGPFAPISCRAGVIAPSSIGE